MRDCVQGRKHHNMTYTSPPIVTPSDRCHATGGLRSLTHLLCARVTVASAPPASWRRRFCKRSKGAICRRLALSISISHVECSSCPGRSGAGPLRATAKGRERVGPTQSHAGAGDSLAGVVVGAAAAQLTPCCVPAATATTSPGTALPRGATEAWAGCPARPRTTASGPRWPECLRGAREGS